MPNSPTRSAAVPTLADAEIAIGLPAAQWPGNCFAAACALVKAGLVAGHAVYGHWLGDTHPDSYFGNRAGLFIPHGWILMPDGRVCDPTRWTFTNESPCIYLGDNQGDYDEAGSQWRKSTRRPMPAYASTDQQIDLSLLERDERDALLSLAGGTPGITMPILFWIANLPLHQLADLTYAACRAIVRIGHQGLLPIDHRHQVEREYGPLPYPVPDATGHPTKRIMPNTRKSPPTTGDATGHKFRRWLTTYIDKNSMSNLDAAKLFGINDSLVGHYLRGQRLPAYGTLQKIKTAVPDLDLNDLFD